jgi:hypothetical protein
MRKSIQIKKINIIESFKDPNINNSINLKNKPCNIFFSPKTRNKFNNKLKSNTISTFKKSILSKTRVSNNIELFKLAKEHKIV